MHHHNHHGKDSSNQFTTIKENQLDFNFCFFFFFFFLLATGHHNHGIYLNKKDSYQCKKYRHLICICLCFGNGQAIIIITAISEMSFLDYRPSDKSLLSLETNLMEVSINPMHHINMSNFISL